MTVSLLDADIALALAWPDDVYHLAAHRWFAANHAAGWATSPLTQLAFVRLSMRPSVLKIPILFGNVMEAPARMTAHDTHRFWPIESGISDIRDEIRARVVGHRQLSDAVLRDPAIRRQGRLATFDRGVSSLLPQGSSQRDSVVIIPDQPTSSQTRKTPAALAGSRATIRPPTSCRVKQASLPPHHASPRQCQDGR